LFNWDACYVHLHRPQDRTIVPVLTMDTVRGRRQRVPIAREVLTPSALMQSVLKHGARLINRTGGADVDVELVRFGDRERPSASLMFVPIRSGKTLVGILSLQSYQPQAYAQQDLDTLQILADHCGDALRRIEVTEALQRAEAKYRSIFENATEGIFQTSPEGRYLSANPAQARLLGYDNPEQLMDGVTNIEKQTYVIPKQRHELITLMDTKERVVGFE